MNKIIGFTLVIFCWVACNNATNLSNGQDGFFGERFSANKAITIKQLVNKMESTEELQTKVAGTVTGVCQVKGCWMTLKNEAGDDIMVKFKDYGFFMPLDLTGEVILNGKAFKQVTTVDELRHYAEDAGKSPEEIAAINQPKEEIIFEASGVSQKK